jgi:hypothetical protein
MVLFISLVQIILSALKGVFTRNISRAEIVQVIMEAVLNQEDLDNFNSSV